MTEDSILIKNIYHMLSYAFRILKETNYEKIKTESFENIHDLFASILSKGIAKQLKQGLHQEYIEIHEDLPLLRGKINLRQTNKNTIKQKRLLSCDYDHLSENNTYNQILKLTMHILSKNNYVKDDYKLALRKNMSCFTDIDDIEVRDINWSTLTSARNNLNYIMLINICFFVVEGLLISTEKGEFALSSYLDEQTMSSLYERFVLEYFRFHHPNLKARAAQVKWNIDDDAIKFLPVMQTDILLEKDDRTLIIDTKYYERSMISKQDFDSAKYRSNNLYQIYAYVKNHDRKHTGDVSGILLYAKTKESITPNSIYSMDGNTISVKTLDLDTPFSLLSEQLDRIALMV